MSRSMPGGRELITRIEDLGEAILELLSFDRRTLVTDPDAVEEARDLARRYTRLILAAVRDDLPPLLARNERNREAASLPERVARLEAELAEVRELLARRPELRLLERRAGE